MTALNRNYELQKNQNYTPNFLVVHSKIENMLHAENLIFSLTVFILLPIFLPLELCPIGQQHHSHPLSPLP